MNLLKYRLNRKARRTLSRHLRRSPWRYLLPAGACCGTLILAGCGGTAMPPSQHALAFSGRIFGGQQPVAGATVQLYQASTSGYAAAVPAGLIGSTVTTDSGGNFAITGTYSCPVNAQVYIVATGGNPGLAAGTSNPNLALMQAIGACSSLQPSTVLRIDERTTVAAAWALAPFMSGYLNIGASATNTAGLAGAFALAAQIADPATGTVPGGALPAGATVPVALINTIADAVASCINSAGGAAGQANPCGTLFTAATSPGGTAPQDTIAAAVNLAHYPAQNTAQVYSLVSTSSPFQPTLMSAPQNLLIGIAYSGGGLSSPAALAVDASGNVWGANSGNNSVTELSAAGAAISPAAGFTGAGLNAPSAIAIDPAGRAWVANRSGNSVSILTSGGAPAGAAITGGGLSSPSAIAIDENGTAWIANAGNSSLSAISSGFTVLSPSGGFTGAGLNAPGAVIVDPY